MSDLLPGNIRPWRRRRVAAIAFGLAAALAATPLVWAEAPAHSSATGAPVALIQQESFAPLVKKVLPAVVNISVTQKTAPSEMSGEPFPNFPNSPFDQFMKRFFEQQGPNGERHFFFGMPGEAQRIALGSGFIIDPSGYIVTNNHVVGDAKKVTVILQDNKKYPAKIIGRDPKTDLAVLKIKADHPLPSVTFGDSSAAQVGDWVMAVGNPFGLGGTVTTGIISARGRNINEGPFDDFLQIDAPINRGNSGGPTFNLQGQVIGINTAIYSPNGGSVGIGFAIPSNVARPIVDQLTSHGKVSRGWLGVQIQQVTPAIAKSLGLSSDHGALVAAVQPHSPGAKAGLKQGDVILSFNGTPIAKLRDLPRVVADTPAHSHAALSVWRDSKKLDLQATVGEMSNNETFASATGNEEHGGTTPAHAVGMQFAPLTADLRQELRLGKDVHGVVVTHVKGGSAADDAGVSNGDVVVAIDQHPVNTPEEAAQRLREAAGSPKKTALLLLNRHGVPQYVGLNLASNKG